MKNADILGDRIKKYESATTGQYFMQSLPLYARIDGRAFHSFSRGLESQFPVAGAYSHQLFKAMQYTCAELVRELNADLGYVQSDEISLGWVDVAKAPFEGRIFKLESVIASLATGFFYKFVFSEAFDEGLPYDRLVIKEKTLGSIPSFDCRVLQVPSLIELANCFVWRENDAIKNSISSYAMEYIHKKELIGKSSDDRIKMLKDIGHPWEDLSFELRRGTYCKRVPYEFVSDKGEKYVRTKVECVFSHERLSHIENKVGYLFEGEIPIIIDRSMTENGPRKVKE